MRIYFHLRRGLLAASAALAALPVAAQAPGQYAPYAQGVPQYQAAGSYPAYQQAAPAPSYAPAQAYSAAQAYAPQMQAPQAQPPQGYAPAAGYAPAQAYAQPYGVPHVARAFQNNPPAAENPPLTTSPDGVPAGVPNGVYPNPAPMADEYGVPPQAQGMPSAAYGNGGAGCNCGPAGNSASAYESYPAADSAYGACNTGYSTYGGRFSHIFGRHGHGYGARGCGYWFGGAYGLLMDRDNANKYPLVFASTTLASGGYPAAGQSVALTTRDADVGYQGGVEFRLGRTFGCGSLDPCGCGTSCGPRWGLEGVYWELFEDDANAQYVDQGALRTYSMMPMYGLEYDNGAGYRPINEYWDYAPPAQTVTDIEVRLARVRSSFEVQNFELNLLRLSMCGGDYGCSSPAVCNVGCDSGSCGADACAGGCATGGCGPVGSRFSCTGVAGVRYMEFDESFMYGVDFDNTGVGAPGSIDGSLDYRSEVQNSLIGAQVGCNGMYRIGCKWGLHANTVVGVYGNDVDVRQYMVSPTGLVRYIGTGEDFNVMASKTDVAMLGELRLGASYQATCNVRLYGGWRAIGVTGIALATDQTPSAFLSAAQMSNYVNSNGSMILHGLQTGVEWNY